MVLLLSSRTTDCIGSDGVILELCSVFICDGDIYGKEEKDLLQFEEEVTVVSLIRFSLCDTPLPRCKAFAASMAL